MSFTRRLFTGAFAAAATSGLSGCAALTPPITALCPESLPSKGRIGPLTVDTHVHIFNGSDIPIRQYIDKVRAKETPGLEGLGEILQEIGDAFSPSGAQEIEVLRKVSAQLAAACGPGGAKLALAPIAEAQHRAGVQALKEASRRVGLHRLRSMRSGGSVASAIEGLPDSYGDFARRVRSRRRLHASRFGGAASAAVTFVVHQLQYRFVNLTEFLDSYQQRSRREIDLALCHMLDFDWALAEGAPTRTPVADQVALMKQMSILTGGRVHGYAPYDPMRWVAHRFAGEPVDPLKTVQDAVTSGGCIGVKLYPPMGFAPYGNQTKTASFWTGSSVARRLQTLDLGPLLDAALYELYAWCVANNVPIMAHTSASNGSSLAFRKLTDAGYWASLPEEVARGLSVNFGHFGDTEVSGNELGRAREYAALMGGPGMRGARFYGDAAYFTHGLDNPATVTAALRRLFAETADKPAPLAQRLMYGSDWEMLLIEGGDTTAYLQNFEQIFAALDRERGLEAAARLSDGFFGLNAAQYLQLRSSDPNSTRGRLDRFYAANGVAKPAWQIKVDREPTLAV